MRHDDAGGAHVEHLLDERRAVVRHTHDRVDARRVGRPHEVVDVADVHRAVLGVDPREVKAHVARDLHRVGAGELDTDSERWGSGCQVGPDPPRCDAHELSSF
jgi:hypothetical protein